jgi:hypothetical protein
MFSRTACFVAASVFAAMGPAAAQVRPQGAPAAQGAAAPSAQGPALGARAGLHGANQVSIETGRNLNGAVTVVLVAHGGYSGSHASGVLRGFWSRNALKGRDPMRCPRLQRRTGCSRIIAEMGSSLANAGGPSAKSQAAGTSIVGAGLSAYSDILSSQGTAAGENYKAGSLENAAAPRVGKAGMRRRIEKASTRYDRGFPEQVDALER